MGNTTIAGRHEVAMMGMFDSHSDLHDVGRCLEYIGQALDSMQALQGCEVGQCDITPSSTIIIRYPPMSCDGVEKLREHAEAMFPDNKVALISNELGVVVGSGSSAEAFNQGLAEI